MKKVLIITSVSVFCLIPIIVYGAFKIYRFFDPYLDRELTSSVTITSNWLEIKPKKPLRVERQIQYIKFDLAESFKPDYDSGGMRLTDGSIVIPEVQLVDQKGRTYVLSHTGIDEKEMVFYLPNLPKDGEFSLVRIRADRPIKVSKIYWRCYNQWDVS